MPKEIEAAIFDVDGMLLDTQEFIYSAYEHTLALYNLEVPAREIIAKQMGLPLRMCYEVFAPEYDNELLRKTHAQFQSEHIELIVPYDGLFEMLEALKPNMKVGVVSSRYGSLLQSLERVGLLDYLDAVVQGDEVNQHKPHPEGIFKVLGALAVEPANASMAGDTAEDIGAGKAAGMALTIGVTHGFGTVEIIKHAEPDYIVRSLEEIPPILLASGIA